jgi:hypothetical protein
LEKVVGKLDRSNFLIQEDEYKIDHFNTLNHFPSISRSQGELNTEEIREALDYMMVIARLLILAPPVV